MKPAPFRLEQPGTVDELCQALETYGEDARILAGGQSLVPMMNFRLATPAVLIEINRVQGLSYIRKAGDRIEIGATTRHVAVKDSPLGVDRTWWSCGAFSVCDGQPTIENSGPCDGYSVSPFGRPPHPSALSHTGIGNVFD